MKGIFIRTHMPPSAVDQFEFLAVAVKLGQADPRVRDADALPLQPSLGDPRSVVGDRESLDRDSGVQVLEAVVDLAARSRATVMIVLRDAVVADLADRVVRSQTARC